MLTVDGQYGHHGPNVLCRVEEVPKLVQEPVLIQNQKELEKVAKAMTRKHARAWKNLVLHVRHLFVKLDCETSYRITNLGTKFKSISAYFHHIDRGLTNNSQVI